MVVGSAWAGQVSEDTAMTVAQNSLTSHIMVYGSWNGSVSPSLNNISVVSYNGEPIAYLVNVNPTGHLLVAYYDDFSPVLFYSPSATLDPTKADDPNAIESWIIPEIYNNVQLVTGNNNMIAPLTNQVVPLNPSMKTNSPTAARIANAWKMMSAQTYNAATAAEAQSAGTATNLGTPGTVGPLLQTTWGQGDPNDLNSPYNEYTPPGTDDGGCAHTYTGCVATAMAQVMNYWNWPVQGVGSAEDFWNGPMLSANFAHSYYWTNMPVYLSTLTTAIQNDAVARLMSDAGISVGMQYGCSDSSIPTVDPVPYSLTNYFQYNNSISHVYRSSSQGTLNYDASSWVSLIVSELTAPTPCPILFTIFSTSVPPVGHEPVIDGYQSFNGTDQVHINYGWSGNYNGFYDITGIWTADYTWSANDQELIIGIKPLLVETYSYVTIISTAGLNGNAWSVGENTVPVGSNVTYTVIPQSGYAISDVKVDGVSVYNQCLGTDGQYTYTFYDVTANHTISASFAIQTFSDVCTNYWAFKNIEDIYNAGITTGCGNGDYCPNDDVTRDEMAAFIIRALYGENFTCNGNVDCSTTTPYFNDVTLSSDPTFFKYIQKLKELGITVGCGNGNYCPSADVRRDQWLHF
jgi:hypothetical protein